MSKGNFVSLEAFLLDKTEGNKTVPLIFQTTDKKDVA